MIYYISDTHFGHENIITLCSRPFAYIETMDALLIEKWQNKVRQQDEVYLIGDFAYCNKKPFVSYLEQLPGKKHLIVGNHDSKLLRNKEAMSHFSSVNKLLEIRDSSLDCDVTLCHYPLVEWPGYFRGAYHVFGHLHNVRNQSFHLMSQVERALNAGVEITDYEPCNLEELIRCNARWLELAQVSRRTLTHATQMIS